MARICRTSDGDVLDTLCSQFYGHLNGTVEAVLDYNQGLAEETQPFRAGLLIFFPDITQTVLPLVQLWD